MCEHPGNCCLTLTRVILIIFNVLFLLCGLALIALGVWILVDPTVLKVISLTSGAYNSGLLRIASILILSTGSAVFLVSLLGFLGVVLEMKALLGIYIALLVIVFCAEVTGAVLAIVYKDWLLDGLDSTLLDSLTNLNPTYYVQNSITCTGSSNAQLWDYVQLKMNCCGIRGAPHSGYEILPYSLQQYCIGIELSTKANRPLTCCVPKNSTSVDPSASYASLTQLLNCQSIKQQGCLDSIENWIVYYSPVLIGIGFGVAFLQVIGFVFAVCICTNVPRNHYKRE